MENICKKLAYGLWIVSFLMLLVSVINGIMEKQYVIIIVNAIIYKTPTKLFINTIFLLFIGITPKYSIVLSLSSFNKMLEPNIPA